MTKSNLFDYDDEDDIQDDIQEGGGLFDFFSGSNTGDINKAAIEAAKNGQYEALLFLVKHNLISNYSAYDEDGKTILHYLVANSQIDSSLIKEIISRKDVKSFINAQDN